MIKGDPPPRCRGPQQGLYLERWRRGHGRNDSGGGGCGCGCGGSGGGAGGVWLHGDGADHVLHCVDFAIFDHFRGWRCLKHGILGPDGRDGHCKRRDRETYIA